VAHARHAALMPPDAACRRYAPRHIFRLSLSRRRHAFAATPFCFI